MSIDCIDSTESDETITWSTPLPAQLNGREYEQLKDARYSRIAQSIATTFEGSLDNHSYEVLSLEEEPLDELLIDFDQYVDATYLHILSHFSDKAIILADPSRPQFSECKSVFSRAIKGIKKGAKKICDGVKKAAKKVAQFVKEHKKEVLIGAAAVAAAAIGAYALAGAVAAQGANREDEEDPSLDPTPEPAPTDPIPPSSEAANPQPDPFPRPDPQFDPFPAPNFYASPTPDVFPRQSPFELFLQALHSNIETIGGLNPANPDAIHQEAPAPGFMQKAIQSFLTGLETIGRGQSDPDPEYRPLFGSTSSDNPAERITTYIEKAMGDLAQTLRSGLDTIGRGIIDAEPEDEALFNAAPVDNPPMQRAMTAVVEALRSGFETIGRGIIDAEPEDEALFNAAPVDNPPMQRAIAAMTQAICSGLETIGRGVIDPAEGKDFLILPPVDRASVSRLISNTTETLRKGLEIIGQGIDEPQGEFLLNDPLIENLFYPQAFVPLSEAFRSGLEIIGPCFSDTGTLLPHIEYMPSCNIETEGVERSGMEILVINGMNTSINEAKSHLMHVKQFAGDLKVKGIYNHTNGVIADLLEIFFLNYSGFAPVTSDLLVEAWTKFHNQNLNNPHAKCFQSAHSMGTIITYDALSKVSKEIQDRIIVVALGPAIIIPEDMCFRSYHYASEKDFVHLGENIYKLTRLAMSNYDSRKKMLWELDDFHKNKLRLTILAPHPDAKGIIDHDYESPTFNEVLEWHIMDYLKRGGKYE